MTRKDAPTVGEAPVDFGATSLRTAGSTNPDLGFAAQLLGAARPFTATPESQRRVWNAIERRNAKTGWSWGNAGMGWMARTALATVVLLGLGTAAMAMFGRPFVKSLFDKLSSAPASAVAPHQAGNAAPTTAPIAPAVVAPLSAQAPVALPEMAAPTTAATGEQSANPEVELVVTAVRALRQEHRPDRAASLLANYRERYPEGVFAEEVLALSIEAAFNQSDPTAASLGAVYLKRYPGGRFAVSARRAIDRFNATPAN